MPLASDLAIKERIAEQFSKAAAGYDRLADVQLAIGEQALALHPSHPGWLLDIGCGTGRLTRRLRDKAAQVVGLDIAQGMLQFASTRSYGQLPLVAADAESLPFRSEALQGVFSSMALQWCQPQQFLAEIHRVLTPGGRATLALMVEGSFQELHDSWQALDQPSHANRFVAADELQAAARDCGFHVRARIRLFHSWHKDVRALLHSVKDIGAGVVLRTPTAPLTRGALVKLQDYYTNCYTQAGSLPLSYRICFLECQK
ncbi:methyltransferase domain-containing protein [Bowmanella dokdonensis]|uniref:Methyltransferase domain-containing protein n=1 Tax=Bowmanella dokdonensis TaxID=751969 RepID=A0A939DRV6_9ALTE|nr:methyltransferase domain-containing protein [Bowmanella dokdonensis]MBN7827217.1 methyltransferase domain-containing protein [Bowmanella dokdonensis]